MFRLAIPALLALVLFAGAAEASHALPWKWSGNNVNRTVYDATSDPRLTAAIEAAVADWNLSAVVELRIAPGECETHYNAITICEGAPCSGSSSATHLKGNRIIAVVISVQSECQATSFDGYVSTVCHHLGEALGLGYQPADSGSCMVPSGTENDHPNAHDFEELAAIY